MLESLRHRLKYTLDHRRMICEIERRYTGRITWLTRLHDLDKVVMYLFLPDAVVNRIHRKFSWHHPGNVVGWLRLSEAVFDWESARYTKPDKPLNARETCLKYYPELKDRVFAFCDKYGIE